MGRFFRFTGLLSLLLLSGCISLNNSPGGAKIIAVEPGKPDHDVALVHFYHPMGLEDIPVPFNFGPAPGILMVTSNTYQLWDGETFIGFLPVANRCFEYRAATGKHTFIGRFVRSNAGNWTVLNAELQAGREYYVAVSQRWNTWKPAVVFETIKPSDPKFANIPSCQYPFAYNHADPESKEAWESHVRANGTLVKSVVDKLQDSNADLYFDPPIQSEDGR